MHRALLFCRGFCVFQGAIFLIAAGVIFWQSARSADWPQATGKITNSYVGYHDVYGATRFWPKVWYEYTVDGKTHAAETIAFFGMAPFGARMLDTWEEADGIVQSSYATAREVQVRYNPRNHMNAFLEVNILSFDLVLMLVLGTLLLLIGWLAAITLELPRFKPLAMRS